MGVVLDVLVNEKDVVVMLDRMSLKKSGRPGRWQRLAGESQIGGNA